MINILTNAAHRQLRKNAGTPSTLERPAKKWRLSMRRGCQEIYHAISLTYEWTRCPCSLCNC